ncbi:MAG: MFS transporter [Acidimicrobiales bacterium]|nr:MFS transporter [Acidimicrobiales bacterium]
MTSEGRTGIRGEIKGPGGKGPGLKRALRALKHREFAIFWSGALASNTGTWIQNMTVPYVLYQITESAFWVGFATFAQFVPQMVLGPLGGSIADRSDRRKVLIITQAAMAVAAFALWGAWVLEFRQLPVILGLLTLSGTIGGLNIPSWQAFVNDLVPLDDLISAITLNSVQFNASRAIGPAIAGMILAWAGPGWAFMANGLSFLFVLGALAVVKPRPTRPKASPRMAVMKGFAEAIRYSRTQPGILIGMAIAVLVASLGNPVQQFTVVFAVSEFDVGALGLAMLNVTLGIGAVAAFFAVSGWDDRLSRATMTRWSMLVYALAIISFAVSPNFETALVSLMFVGGGFLAVISISNTSLQIIVADHIRGRVMALRIMAFSGSYPLGALIQGWVADRIGVRMTVGGAGTILLLFTLVVTRNANWLPRLDDPHDESEPVPAQR